MALLEHFGPAKMPFFRTVNNQEVKSLDPKQSESFSTFMAHWMNDEAWLTVTLDIMDMHTRCPVLKEKGRF